MTTTRAPSSEHKSRDYYEDLYQSSSEPWNYRDKGAEVLRHARIVQVLKEIRPSYPRILDIGASLGQLTQRLSELGPSVWAFDISLTAVQKARAVCRPADAFHFLLARLPGIPFQKGRFDLIIASDCIHEFVPEGERVAAIREIGSMLNPCGVALFCDYMRPGREDEFCALIRQSGLEIVRMDRMHDRVWYQFESWFKAVREFGPVKKILRAVWLAKILRWPSMMMGKYGSTHVLIVAGK